MSPFSDFSVLLQLALPARGENHEERLDHFYRKQAVHYDSFRKRLLHGRVPLFEELSRRVEPGMTWIDIGGGTGSNCEILGDRLGVLKRFYIVDLSRVLLEVADGRVFQRHWANVETVHADATNVSFGGAKADIVTLSYSLTMMPHWWAVLENAHRLLKPGGLLGIADFYVSEKHPPPGLRKHSWAARGLWPTWFGFDNVFLNPDHVPYLHEHFTKELFREDAGRVPYLFGLKAPYYLFVGKKE